MLKTLEKPIIAVPLLLVLSIYLYFFQIDKIALTDPDETFYAQTAKEMFNKGEWLTPILYGKPQFEKPILFYSFIEASYKLFGVNEFAARFPSALFGLLGIIAIYFLGRLFFNNRTGLFSAIILATNVEYIVLSVGCVTDMMLSTFLLLGVLFFFYGRIKGKGYFYILSATSFAFATLTKGPIFIILAGFILVLYLFFVRDFSIFKKFKTLFLSIAVFILIAVPWYLIMYKLHGNNFIDEFFGFHNVTRFLTPEHRTGSQIYYNIPVILGGFIPWSVFLPLGFWYMFKNLKSKTGTPESRKASIFILLWFFVIFIFFTVSSTKLPTYIFPCFISLALMTGKLWDDFLMKPDEKVLSSGIKFSYYFLLIAVILALIGGYIFLRMDYPDMIGSALITAAFLIFGLLLSLVAFSMKKFLAVFFLIAYSIVLAIYPLSSITLPNIEGYETEKPMSKVILSLSGKDDIIGGEQHYRAGLAFYTDRTEISLVDNNTQSPLLSSAKRVWCVVKDKNVIKGSNVAYSFADKRLLTNKTDNKK